jgi:uncharacterized membrane protein (DUF485 family)
MDDSQVERILHNPKFQEMVSKQRYTAVYEWSEIRF